MSSSAVPRTPQPIAFTSISAVKSVVPPGVPATTVTTVNKSDGTAEELNAEEEVDVRSSKPEIAALFLLQTIDIMTDVFVVSFYFTYDLRARHTN